jgi:hypothetical protein
MAAAATKSRGVKIYLISVELLFSKNECYSALYCTYLLLVVTQVSVNIQYFLSVSWNLQKYLPPPLQSHVNLKTVASDILPWSLLSTLLLYD